MSRASAWRLAYKVFKTTQLKYTLPFLFIPSQLHDYNNKAKCASISTLDSLDKK